MVIFIEVILEKSQLFIFDVVGERVSKEVCDVGSYIDLRVFNKKGHQVRIFSDDFSQTGGIFFDILR